MPPTDSDVASVRSTRLRFGPWNPTTPADVLLVGSAAGAYLFSYFARVSEWRTDPGEDGALSYFPTNRKLIAADTGMKLGQVDRCRKRLVEMGIVRERYEAETSTLWVAVDWLAYERQIQGAIARHRELRREAGADTAEPSSKRGDPPRRNGETPLVETTNPPSSKRRTFPRLRKD